MREILHLLLLKNQNEKNFSFRCSIFATGAFIKINTRESENRRTGTGGEMSAGRR